jgi:S-adenosylmethionine:tRNA ribosyltransferase-isomerase
MDLSRFEYSLPRELIAQSPAKRRDESRLMIIGNEISHDVFENLDLHLQAGDVLVLNDSKVLKAELVGRKETGGRVELLVVNFSGYEARCLIRGKKLKEGTRIEIGDVTCEVTKKLSRGFNVRFDHKVEKLLNRYGKLPLPYYVKSRLTEDDRYQTIYSKNIGSIAAPTAGLHFTDELLNRLRAKGVKIAHLTLHIGPSTFLPLRSGENGLNRDPEYFSIDERNAGIINQGIEKDSLIAVGTTTVKALESAAIKKRIVPGEGLSDIFIAPGYQFKIPLKGMITNFHLPRSTLLLLVCAIFGRDKILDAYKEAITSRYRFYSFGDSMLLRR